MKKGLLAGLVAFNLLATPMVMARDLDGAGSTGGGYSYKYTSLVNIRQAQYELINELKMAFHTTYPSTPQLVHDKLIEVIQNLKFAPTLNKKIISGDIEEFKDLDYDLENNTITALQPLFDRFNIENEEFTEKKSEQVKRILIHEATHLFNIGISNDQESYNLSKAIISRLKKNKIICSNFKMSYPVKNCEQSSDSEKKIHTKLKLDNKDAHISLTNQSTDQYIAEVTINFDGISRMLILDQFERTFPHIQWRIANLEDLNEIKTELPVWLENRNLRFETQKCGLFSGCKNAYEEKSLKRLKKYWIPEVKLFIIGNSK